MDRDKKITFLLGAGASRAADEKMPLVGEITETVLAGKNEAGEKATRFSSPYGPRYSFSKTQHYSNRYSSAEREVSFCKAVEAESSKYFSRFDGVRFNYENLSYVVAAMSDSLSGEYPSPIPIPFLENVLKRVDSILAHPSYSEESRDERIKLLCSDVLAYISDMVAYRLARGEKNICFDKLSVISEAPSEITIPIFTLNHDTVLEKTLTNSNKSYDDGFTIGDDYLRISDWDTYDKSNAQFSIYKLHGAINWWMVCRKKGDRPELCIPRKRDAVGRIMESSEKAVAHHIGRRMILIGSLNKPLEYSKPIYVELIHRFYQALKETDHLVICGYGFGDRAINDYLFGWFDSDKVKRCTVISKDREDAEKALNCGEGGICHQWSKWQEKGWFRIMEKSLEKTNPEDVFD